MVKLVGITILAILLLTGNAAAVVMQECVDRNYVSSDTDYIVEGTIEKVESKLVEEESGINGQSVYTYNSLKI